jgi:hypothetical protein
MIISERSRERIREMADIAMAARKSIPSTIDLIKKAELEYERLRQLNYAGILSTSQVTNAATNLIGGYTPKRLVGVFQNQASDVARVNARARAYNQALISLASTVFPRAVGPVEELPFRQLQDSVRRKMILTRTQLGAEQRLIAKFMQGRYNVWVKNEEEYSSTRESDIPVVKYDRNALMNVWGKELEDQYTRNTGLENPRFGYRDESFPFYIHNLANGIREVFPAFIKTLTETATASWNSQSFINRSEDVYIYQGAERSFDMGITLFASSSGQKIRVKIPDIEKNIGFPMHPIVEEGTNLPLIDFMTKEDLWRKINFLHQCTRPQYVDDRFYKAPYCLLTIGHLYQDIMAIIESINLSYEPLIWDLNIDADGAIFGGIKPMVIDVTISGKLLHRSPPTASYQFYRGRIKR